jgi:hypothetical protein
MAAGALALACAASLAHAAPADNNDFTPQPNRIGPTPPHRNLQWDARTGRWGLDLEMPQASSTHDPSWSETRIGGYYKFGPNLRVGPTVSFGSEQTPVVRQGVPVEQAPRVRLETTFKF